MPRHKDKNINRIKILIIYSSHDLFSECSLSEDDC